MTVLFTDPKPAPAPSLAYKLDVQGKIRFRQLSACKLVYEDNNPELIEVWVAEKPRSAVVEVTGPDYNADTRFHPVFI